jgi:hypothetical protein
VFARPACGLRSPLAATASGQVLSPGFSTRLPGLQITRRHQGFIRIRPSGLPLARLLPRTERGSLGFFPELRTPTGRTRRRTSGRGSVTNTNRELRDRHRRPPIHKLTHMRDIASHPQVLIIAPVVKSEVISAISNSHGLSVGDLVLVPPGSIPITTTGKVR